MNDLIGISQSSKFATINQSKRGIIRLKKASSRGDVLRSITIQNEELEDNSNKDKIIHHSNITYYFAKFYLRYKIISY